MNSTNVTTHGFWRRHADKIGAVGSLFAALCCLGIPAVLSIVSAIGLGFIVNDAILMPLLAVFLAITLYGLWNGYRRHGKRAPLALGAVSAAGLLMFLWFSSVLAGISLGALIVATFLNVWFARTQHEHTAL